MNGKVLFGAWPGLALGIVVVGFVLREALFRRSLAADKVSLTGAETRWSGARLWWWSWIALLAAHLLATFFPQTFLAWNAQPARLYALEGVGFLLGLMALAGWVSALFRHLAPSRTSPLGQLVDSAFLSVVVVSLISGLLTAARHRWASSWATVTMAPYIHSLLRARPTPELVTQMPVLVQLHVASAFTTVALLPFTHVGLVLLAAVHRFAGVFLRPVASAGDAIEKSLRGFSPANWIWPEEDPLVALSPSLGTGSPPHGSKRAGSAADDDDNALLSAEATNEPALPVSDGR
jgi:nitrate reductase gamma subunit